MKLKQKEILEEGISSSLSYYTHYYVSIEDECSYFSYDSSIVEPIPLQPYNQFLRLLQIQMLSTYRVRSEPIIDYSSFQILTFIDHVDKLHQISKKKANIEEERARKQKDRELTKLKGLKRELL